MADGANALGVRAGADATGCPPLAEPESLTARLVAFDTATLYEAGGQRGALLPGITALSSERRVAGPALTVLTARGDNLALHAAVASARPGEVIVAQCHDAQTGGWGEVLTVAAMARGIAALVVDGAVRDLDAIRELGFPVFARGTSISAATKVAPGHIRLPIDCGGQIVRPGDYVVADVSGLVVIEAEAVEQTLVAAAARVAKESRMMEQLRAGATTVDLLGLGAALAPETAPLEGGAR
jgi:4-hydroxy-4-methyl-2-oxoglutarate aldolase